MDYKKRYVMAFDEINKLTEASFKLSSGDPKQIKDDMLSFLINAYQLGIRNSGEMLGASIAMNTELMRQAIYMNIGGKTFENRVDDHIEKIQKRIGSENPADKLRERAEGDLEEDDLIGLIMLAESEFHRVYNAGANDGAKTYASTVKASTGAEPVIYKEWLTKLDDKVRMTHDYLEGERVPLGADFYTYDGDHAPYPGGFANAENNVNCRCIVVYGKDA